MSRMRSPSYPSISLNQAVDLVAKIHRACRSNIIARETAVHEMGYSGLTGRSMKVLSALLQFGLLEKTGKGDVKVTQRGVDILHSIEPQDRDEALKDAALAPQLFKDIHERFPDGIPSENAIRSFLIKQDFMDAAIGPAITAFMETYRSVQHIRESERHGDIDQGGLEPDQEILETPMQPQPSLPALIAPATLVPLAFSNGDMPDLNKINMDIRGDRVMVSGLLDLKGLRALEKKIAGLKALLTPDDDFDDDNGRAYDEDRDPRD